MTAPTSPRTGARRGPTAALPPGALDHLDPLLERRRTGHSLEAPFYTDPAIFAADMEAVFGTQWFFAASAAELPEPGDYVTIEVGPYALIVLRAEDGSVTVLHNVCRHRGARVLPQKTGSTGNLVCPYHSWTYSPAGELIHASAPGETDFDRSCLGLRRAHGLEISGLVFVSVAPERPQDLLSVAPLLEPYIGPHELGATRVAYQQDLVEEGNWKLVMENNRECYHCDGHPELACSLFPTWGLSDGIIPTHLEAVWQRNLHAEDALRERCDRYGLPYAVLEELDTREAGFRISREPLDGDGESFSEDGHRLSKKLLGDLPDFRLGRCSLHLQPNSWFHLLSDHVITFAAFPLDAGRTLVRTTWLVADDAVEGVDYDLETLTHTWKQTNIQDRAFVELCQQGVTSPVYEPGPYMRSEYQVEAFISWYIQRMRDHRA